jgi:uncharacterized protein (TIGR02145 family)
MKSKLWFSLLVLLVLIGLTFCDKNDPSYEPGNSVNHYGPVIDSVLIYGSVADIDSNVYKTFQNSSHTWMVENLKTTRYNDGTLILMKTGTPTGGSEWWNMNKGAFCWYDNDITNKALGAIYNWHAVNTGKLCPVGWHVPTYTEWTSLITSLGGTVNQFNELIDNADIYGASPEDDILWASSEDYIRGGFTVGAGACLNGWGFCSFDEGSFWWTSTEYVKHNFTSAYMFSVHIIGHESQTYGFNVRCFKD